MSLIKIYRIRPSAESGDFLSRDLVQEGSGDWFRESRERIESGQALNMKWNAGGKKKPILDLLPSTAPGLVFGEAAMDLIGSLLPEARRFAVSVNGNVQFSGVKLKPFSENKTRNDHAFVMYPRHSFNLVTEVFKQKWDASGLRGATFIEVDELEGDRFLKDVLV